jgi:single-strand DNA-binding protein
MRLTMSRMTESAETRASDNHVVLCGRLAAEATVRELPSGDVLAVFRVTVARPPGDRARVDSIECAAVKPRVRKTLARAKAGDSIEVIGSQPLRRRRRHRANRQA